MTDTDYFIEQLDLSALDSKDIDAISALEVKLFGAGAWSRASVSTELSAPDRTYFVARQKDTQRVIAYAGFWFDGDDAEIMTIGVSGSYQGRGIASKLMDCLKQAAQERGAHRVLLEVAVSNDPALALYRKHEFKKIGIRKRYYQPENVDAYTMAFVLNDDDSVARGHSKHNPVGFSIK